MIRKKKAAAKVTNAHLLTVLKREIQGANAHLLKMLMQEIADVRLELKQDINNLGIKMDKMGQDLEGKIGKVDRKLDLLNAKVDRNHEWCIRNIDGLDTRVRVLETARA